MLALVSVKDDSEALKCIDIVDIVDVKNPAEGSLGASYVWVIEEVSRICRERNRLVSATVGDLDKSGLASLASYAIAGKVDFVKVGLMADRDKAEEIIKSVMKSVNGKSKVIAVGYADYYDVNSISPFELLDLVREVKVDGVMIDTALKVKPSLEIMDYEEVERFIKTAKGYGLICALAGGLKWEHLEIVKSLNPDVVGVRGLVCGGEREGELDPELVERFVRVLKS